MFQFRNETSGVQGPSNSNALPNTYGKVRTFKEDLENFESRGTLNPPEPDTTPLQITEKKTPQEIFPSGPQSAPPTPEAPKAESIPANPFQSVPTPPPISSQGAGLPEFKSAPSESFFSQNPPATDAHPAELRIDQLPGKESKSKLLPTIIVILVIALAGGGFYYWRFYIKNTAPSAASAPTGAAQPSPASSKPSTSGQQQPTASQQPSASSATPQNKNLHQLVVDTSQNQLAIKDAVQKFATDFGSSSTDASIAEIKILDKNNQPIGKKDFFSGMGMTVPDTVAMKFSEDYSLFVTKTNGDTRVGLASRTVTSSGLADAMKNWEPTIVKDLTSLYMTPTTVPAETTFNSSQYKNADIRYSNLSSPSDTSLDYSVISNFLIIGTAKDSTRTILDYMAGK